MNRLVLAAVNTAGSWPAPTYALGRYQLDNNGIPMRDKPLLTYLIVNICLDLGESVVREESQNYRAVGVIGRFAVIDFASFRGFGCRFLANSICDFHESAAVILSA